MRQPFLDMHQAHAIVNQFDGFRVPERMIAKVKNLVLLVYDLRASGQAVQSKSNSYSLWGKTFASACVAHKEELVRVVVWGALFLCFFNHCLHHSCYFLSNRDAMIE